MYHVTFKSSLNWTGSFGWLSIKGHTMSPATFKKTSLGYIGSGCVSVVILISHIIKHEMTLWSGCMLSLMNDTPEQINSRANKPITSTRDELSGSFSFAACVVSNKRHAVTHPVTPHRSTAINLSDPAGPGSGSGHNNSCRSNLACYLRLVSR